MRTGTSTIARRLNARLSHVTSRLDRIRTPLGLLVLAVGAFLAYVAFVSTTGPPFQSRYQVTVSVPADAPTLRPGQAVRIGGQLAGLISDVDPDPAAGGSSVTANITKTQFRPLPADTRAYVRVHSIVYATYLELRPGRSSQAIANGERLARPARSGVDLLEVVQLFDRRTRGALRTSTVNLGFGVAGRGAEANEALASLPPLAADATAQLEALTAEPGALGRIVRGSSRTARGLRGERADDVAAAIGSADETLGVLAARDEELGTALRLLPPFQDQFLATAPKAEALLEDVPPLARELQPALRALNRQLPAAARLLGRGETLRSEGDRIADAADPVLRTARPVLWGLYPTLASLRPLNADLRVLKATVEPYKPEIAAAGRNLAQTTSYPSPGGLASGAPSARVVPIFTCHPWQNPIPDPGEAMRDARPC